MWVCLHTAATCLHRHPPTMPTFTCIVNSHAQLFTWWQLVTLNSSFKKHIEIIRSAFTHSSVCSRSSKVLAIFVSPNLVLFNKLSQPSHRNGFVDSFSWPAMLPIYYTGHGAIPYFQYKMFNKSNINYVVIVWVM